MNWKKLLTIFLESVLPLIITAIAAAQSPKALPPGYATPAPVPPATPPVTPIIVPKRVVRPSSL